MRDVCVIGGNRYFGKRLTARLLAAGDRVTVINRGSSVPPVGAIHLVADRNDEHSLEKALGSRTFDVVVDQVCYTPRQAAVARSVFAGRTRRYVMTSTVEVYEYEDSAAPVREEAVDPRSVAVDLELPWDDPDFLASHYGEGKRQAEAVLASDPAFPYVAARIPGGRTVFRSVEVGEASPFSFTRSYGMDNSRATGLGFTFGQAREWLPRAAAETLASVSPGKDN
ncbi:MAG: hypothetical protein QOC85_549 [Streptomyces sp.]|nr:hypothetical protein [Streptomyces sp.]